MYSLKLASIINVILISLVCSSPTTPQSFYETIKLKCLQLDSFPDFKNQVYFKECTDTINILKVNELSPKTLNNVLCLTYYNSLVMFCNNTRSLTKENLLPRWNNSFELCSHFKEITNLSNGLITSDNCNKTCDGFDFSKKICATAFYYMHNINSSQPKAEKVSAENEKLNNQINVQNYENPINTSSRTETVIKKLTDTRGADNTSNKVEVKTDIITDVKPIPLNQNIHTPILIKGENKGIKQGIINSPELIKPPVKEVNTLPEQDVKPAKHIVKSSEQVYQPAGQVVKPAEQEVKPAEQEFKEAVKPPAQEINNVKLERPQDVSNKEKIPVGKITPEKVEVQVTADIPLQPQVTEKQQPMIPIENPVEDGDERPDEEQQEEEEMRQAQEENGGTAEGKGVKSNVIDSIDSDGMEGDSYFFSYFMVICIMFVMGYVAYHNRQKLFALLLEGKRNRRPSRTRRPNSANYHKLDSNLEEAITSECSKNTSHVIY